MAYEHRGQIQFVMPASRGDTNVAPPRPEDDPAALATLRVVVHRLNRHLVRQQQLVQAALLKAAVEAVDPAIATNVRAKKTSVKEVLPGAREDIRQALEGAGFAPSDEDLLIVTPKPNPVDNYKGPKVLAAERIAERAGMVAENVFHRLRGVAPTHHLPVYWHQHVLPEAVQGYVAELMGAIRMTTQEADPALRIKDLDSDSLPKPYAHMASSIEMDAAEGLRAMLRFSLLGEPMPGGQAFDDPDVPGVQRTAIRQAAEAMKAECASRGLVGRDDIEAFIDWFVASQYPGWVGGPRPPDPGANGRTRARASVPQPGVTDAASVPQPGVTDAASVPQPCVTDAASVPQPCVTDAASVPQPGVTEAAPVPQPGVTEAAKVPQPSVTEAAPVPQPSVTEAAQVPQPSVTEAAPVPQPSVTEAAQVPQPGITDAEAPRNSALVQAYRPRYRNAMSKAEKGRLLDEFVSLSGYHRKHAVRVLGQADTGPPKPGLDEAVRNALVVVWEEAGRLGSRSLKARMRVVVPMLLGARILSADPIILDRLLSLSAATIDRMIAPVRRKVTAATPR